MLCSVIILFTISETKTLTIFWLLHHLFPPQQKIRTDSTGAKLRKKFSVPDSQESFMVMADTKDELDTKLKLLKLQSRNIQPRLLIVGQLSKIMSISLYFDEISYPFLTIINAFDILFKTFFVFNLEFPEESEIFYTFIQSLLYDLPTSKKFVKVSSIKHEILEPLI